MKQLRPASSEQVVESWVRGETASPRFRHLYEAAWQCATSPSAVDLLAEVRGWPDRGYCRGLPRDTTWSLVQLDEADVDSILYMDWDYWNEVSGGTRRPADAIRLQGWARGIDWSATLEPLVIVTDGIGSRLVVVEGHSRLTGYVGDLGRWDAPVTAFLGGSLSMADWWAF